jgi:predicted SnoaL-like aldol condensation-catalyzing enzyme
MPTPQAQTTTEQNKQLVIRWFEEVWNQGRRQTIHDLFAAQGVLHDGKNTYRGPEEFCRFYDMLKTQFSNISIKPVIGLAEGNLVCTHFSVECTHTASDTRVQFTAIAIVRIANGQFIEAWQNWDAAAIMQQVTGFTVA